MSGGGTRNVENYNSWEGQQIWMHRQVLLQMETLQKELDTQKSKLLDENALLKTLEVIRKLKLTDPNVASLLGAHDRHILRNILNKKEQTLILKSTMANAEIEQGAHRYIQMAEKLLVTNTHEGPNVHTPNLDGVVSLGAVQDPLLRRSNVNGSVITNPSQDACLRTPDGGDQVIAIPSEEDVPLPAGTLQVAQSFGPKSGAPMQLQTVKLLPGLAPSFLAPSVPCQDECMTQKGGPRDREMSRHMSIQEALAPRLPKMPESTPWPSFGRQPSQVPSVLFQRAGLQSSQSEQALQPPLSLQRIEEQPTGWPPIPGQPSQDSPAVLPQEACHDFTSADSKLFCFGSATASRLDPLLIPSDTTEPTEGDAARDTAPSRNGQSHYCSSAAREVSPLWHRAASSTTRAAKLEPAPEFNIQMEDVCTDAE